MTDQQIELTPAEQAEIDNQVAVRRYLKRRWPAVFTAAEIASGLNMPRELVDRAIGEMTTHGDRAAIESVYRGKRTGPI